MLAWLVCATMFNANDLQAFVQGPDKAFAWREASRTSGQTELVLTSQVWKGHPWSHSMVVLGGQPSKTAILYVTGLRVDRTDMPFLEKLSKRSGLTVVGLFDIPNQPIFGEVEDGLIAYTFGKYLETSDPTWPLLMPMTKAVLRAMDALQQWNSGIERFVVVGASKRGWTTWLTAASADKRVAGIAPMAYDFLNFPSQLNHQLASWGEYSEMLSDYVKRDQPQAAESESGRKLIDLVDPYSYRNAMALPKLIVVGTNDRYWTVDAHKLYAGHLKGNTYFRVIPNVGHGLGDGSEAASSIGFFARGVAGLLEREAQSQFDAGKLKGDAKTWYAGSATRDFRNSSWSTQESKNGWTASFTEWAVSSGDYQASFTSTVTVTPPSK